MRAASPSEGRSGRPARRCGAPERRGRASRTGRRARCQPDRRPCGGRRRGARDHGVGGEIQTGDAVARAGRL
eukprot:52082-Chlamydomonas_euryale.AAC.7